jgi:hypothetical protein
LIATCLPVAGRPAGQAGVDRGPGEVRLADEMSQPAFQLGGSEQIGTAVMKARQVKGEAGVDSALAPWDNLRPQ